MADEYFPRGNGRGWAITIIAAIGTALLAPSITAIIVVSQMHQKQADFDKRLQERRAEFEARFQEHKEEAAHGEVAGVLQKHDTRLDGQERSLDTVRHSNDRLATTVHKLTTDLRVLEQQVDIEHRYGIDP